MIGDSIIILNSVDSTSNYIAKAISAGRYNWGTAILAHFQTNGRGQREAIWQSAPGRNLTFSFALRLEGFDPRSFFTLSRGVSLALYQCLFDELGEGVKIKWPNDLLYNRKKIAGILIESRIAKTPYAICGIGFNVNQTNFGSMTKATSLKIETTQTFSIEVVLQKLLRFLNEEWKILNQGDFRTQKIRYDERLFGINQSISFKIQGRSYEGLIKGTSQEGQLIVEIEGRHHSFQPKEIKLDY
ncbi:MAG: biotin--[acetyl-CoA-carboxylase] ligase [Flavobacteriales bacterium]|nr:biotin--[acetyl-CoA-carboxylase] ligase [Flavobacteriales bacterium]